MTSTQRDGLNDRPAVLVAGGSGLIGRAIQRLALKNGDEGSFSFTFAKNRRGVLEGVRPLKLNLLQTVPKDALDAFSSAIYVAGSSDHALARSDPLADLNRNTVMFLNFMESFKGNLVLLSSQAVYYGLSGMIGEDSPHIAEVPYGLSKQMTEEYAKYFLRTRRLSSLWIARLMYSFGMGERASRIIPSCARAANGIGRLELRGGGASLLNPLPASFVADVLVHASRTQWSSGEKLVATNLNLPAQVRVVDIAEFLRRISCFEYSVRSDGEDWPVRFWGDTKVISAYLEKWRMPWPDIWKEIKIYFKELVATKARP